MVKRISILGATGSIGGSVRSIMLKKRDQFEIEALVCGQNVDTLAALAKELNAKTAVIAHDALYDDLKELLRGTGIEAKAGKQAVIEAAQTPVDVIVSAITGIAGLEPTYAAICAGQRIALANKEALVCAGALLMSEAKRAGAVILPLDSEHNALFQALGERPISSVERMTLTASGGPFLNWTLKQIEAATPAQALNHPNWQMGAKVSIDSATLMNKGLELIEAHHLFALNPQKLDVLVHPQSIIHGLVMYKDGSVIAGLAPPDMRIPIAHCMSYPERLEIDLPRLNLATICALSFAEPDRKRFICLELAETALKEGGAMPIVLNGANEIAVEAFLRGQIKFGGIARLVSHVLNQYKSKTIKQDTPMTLQDVLSVNLISRESAQANLVKGLDLLNG